MTLKFGQLGLDISPLLAAIDERLDTVEDRLAGVPDAAQAERTRVVLSSCAGKELDKLALGLAVRAEVNILFMVLSNSEERTACRRSSGAPQ